MKRKKIIVIEQDSAETEFLCSNLLKKGYDIIGPFAESKKAIKAANSQSPDLALVDVWLEDNQMDGIQLTKTIKKKSDLPVIFLSRFSDKATRLRAKALNPRYFFTKPIPFHQLEIAIEFALNETIDRNVPQLVNNNVIPAFDSPDYFFIKQNGKYLRIPPGEISCLKAAGSQTELFMQNNRYVVSTHLSDLLKQIHMDKLVQCHRSHAVNLNWVLSFDNNCLYVNYQDQPKEIPIGESYRKNVFNNVKIIKTR